MHNKKGQGYLAITNWGGKMLQKLVCVLNINVVYEYIKICMSIFVSILENILHTE